MDVEKLSNILGAETVKKIYEDGASGPMQETGKAATDLIKALRLFTAPIQFAAAFQDRLVKYLDKVRGNVPEERQMEAPASIAGPIIERLKYQEEENHLAQLYLNLLSRAIDKERIQEAHPGFIHVIDQLSPDEALLLYFLSNASVLYSYRANYKNDIVLLQHQELKEVTPAVPLSSIVYFSMYAAHLTNLGLIVNQVISSVPVYKATVTDPALPEIIAIDFKAELYLTEFGRLFVKACIPPNGFIVIEG